VTALTDEDVPDALGDFLRDRGYGVVLVRDTFGVGTPDHVIARAASERGLLVYTFNRRHFLNFARRISPYGALTHPGLSVVSFDLRRPQALARLRVVIEDIEAVYQNRVVRGGGRLIAVVGDTVLRFEDPERQPRGPAGGPP
jgi:Domain of unknown function (DUF5615)